MEYDKIIISDLPALHIGHSSSVGSVRMSSIGALPEQRVLAAFGESKKSAALAAALSIGVCRIHFAIWVSTIGHEDFL